VLTYFALNIIASYSVCYILVFQDYCKFGHIYVCDEAHDYVSIVECAETKCFPD
jgi:hypothetical protein